MHRVFVDPTPTPDPLIEQVLAAWYGHPIEAWNAAYLAGLALRVARASQESK